MSIIRTQEIVIIVEKNYKKPSKINKPLVVILLVLMGYIVWTAFSNDLIFDSKPLDDIDPEDSVTTVIDVNSDIVRSSIEKITVGLTTQDNLLYEKGFKDEFIYATGMKQLTKFSQYGSVATFNDVDLDVSITNVLGSMNYILPESITYNCMKYDYNKKTSLYEKTDKLVCDETYSKYITKIEKAYKEDNKLIIIEHSLYALGIKDNDNIIYSLYSDNKSIDKDPLEKVTALDLSSYLTKYNDNAGEYKYTFTLNENNVYIFTQFEKIK